MFALSAHHVTQGSLTAQNLAIYMQAMIQQLATHEARVIAIATDAAGECRQARLDVVVKDPTVTALDHSAHHVRIDIVLFCKLCYFL